jgi:hypothetical protein
VRRSRLICLALLFLSTLGNAQVPVTPEEVSKVNDLFDSQPEGKLACSIHSDLPFLDFKFRYNAGFLISARIDQFASGEPVVAYLRVSPREGRAILLSKIFEPPVMPPSLAERPDARLLGTMQFNMSGEFWIGQGHYRVEVMLLDGQHRSCRKHWDIHTPKRPHEADLLALEPNTVEPAQAPMWDGQIGDNSLRLTVLLHAAPMFPFSPKLRDSDRAFLLQSLSSLLKQLRCKSVQVIAFNLERRQEIFREDRFGADALDRLSRTLADFELATVPIGALKRQEWPGLLVRLAQEQAGLENPSDVVIFLGPTSPYFDNVPSAVTRSVAVNAPHFFYFEYYPFTGSDFGDPIDSLTRDLNGTVYKVHSADQLSEAIQKMLRQIKPRQ